MNAVLKTQPKIELATFSSKATEAVKATGGSVVARCFNPLALLAYLKRGKFVVIPTKSAGGCGVKRDADHRTLTSSSILK